MTITQPPKKKIESGADPEISERGGKKPNSRKRGRGGGIRAERDFSLPLSVTFL